MNRTIPIRDRKESLGDRNHRYLDLHVVDASIDRLGRNLSLNGQNLTGNALFTGDIVYSGEITFNNAVAIDGDLSITAGSKLIFDGAGGDDYLTYASAQIQTHVGGTKVGGWNSLGLFVEVTKNVGLMGNWVYLTAPGVAQMDFYTFKILRAGVNNNGLYLVAGNRISFDAAGAQNIVGDAGGITFKVPTGDEFEFQINSVAKMLLTSVGSLYINRSNVAYTASNPMLDVYYNGLSAGGAYNLVGIQSQLAVSAQSLTSAKGFATSTQANTTGDTIGFSANTCINTGDGDISAFKADVIAATGDGDVHGFLITDTLSTSGAGTVYAIKSLATELSLFSGDLAIAAAKSLVLDGETGNVRFVWNAGANQIDVFVGGNLAGHINEAVGFVND